MSKIFDMPITVRLLAGADTNSGIMKFRNTETKPSWGRVFATEAMLVGTALVATAEIATRVALMLLAMIPMMFTETSQAAWAKHFLGPVMFTSVFAGALPMMMVDNVIAMRREKTDMGAFMIRALPENN